MAKVADNVYRNSAECKLVKVVAVLGRPYSATQPECKQITYVGTFTDGAVRVIRKSWNAYRAVVQTSGKFKFTRSAVRNGVHIEWHDKWVNDRWVSRDAVPHHQSCSLTGPECECAQLDAEEVK